MTHTIQARILPGSPPYIIHEFEMNHLEQSLASCWEQIPMHP